MSSSSLTTCAICLGVVKAGQGQAIFTAECSHTFHFGCITTNVKHGNYLCPICRAKWNDLPFAPQNLAPNATIPFNPFLEVNRRPQLPPIWPEPLLFSDDEPTANPTSSATPARLPHVGIKAVAERAAVAASDSIPEFAILVGLKAPPLSADALKVQRAPIDLVTVLDASGSMHTVKMDLLKQAMMFVIDNLGPCDRLSIVSFATNAHRMLPLCRMTECGREAAKLAVDSLQASGQTNIVDGLKKGVRVLEERRHHNPVSSIIFLSDGIDTGNCSLEYHSLVPYLRLLSSSICPGTRGPEDERQQRFPIHAFGFGLDHDPVVMHAIADSSGGTFSFIESYDMVQDAFASCIGGLLSVVAQELHLTVRSASSGVEIKSIPSGRHASEISNQGSQGAIEVGDLYADEEKKFLINVSVPILTDGEGGKPKTPLLEITCSYKNAVSMEIVRINEHLVEIRRPDCPSSDDMIINLEIDRQRNLLRAADSIAEAQRMAESGNLGGAQTLLSNRRSSLLSSASGQLGDDLCMWLEAEMKETQVRMGNLETYERLGRAYALSNMIAHGYQRANTRGGSFGSGGSSAMDRRNFSGYITPNMVSMVNRSRELNKIDHSAQK